jgi:hypothetical protein
MDNGPKDVDREDSGMCLTAFHRRFYHEYVVLTQFGSALNRTRKVPPKLELSDTEFAHLDFPATMPDTPLQLQDALSHDDDFDFPSSSLMPSMLPEESFTDDPATAHTDTTASKPNQKS